MKWSTAVTQLGALAEQCERFASPRSALIPLRVTQLWAVGDVLGRPRDLDRVTVALGVDVPPELVPWWCNPEGAQWWAEMTRLSKNPVRAWWRSCQAPIWNHRIIGPVLIWDDTAGTHAGALSAIGEGRGAAAGLEEPSQEDYVVRMSAELQISLTELQRRTHEYDTDRTTRLGVRADALFAAAQGYLDVLAAQTDPAATDGS